VSNQAPSRPTTRQAARAGKKINKREAAARRAAAERRRKTLIAVAGAVAAIAVIVVIAVVFSGGGKKAGTPSATGASAASTAFPPLPPGADPALKTKPAVSAGTGDLTALKVTTLIQGTGDAVASGQTIAVNYVGVSFKTGQEFDSSWSRSDPFSFAVGGGNVIKGWDQGLVGVKVGSRVQLDIPSDLAYGDNPSGGQPAGPLRFVVDVLSAK
jgi:peptidylprolyl isomerase